MTHRTLLLIASVSIILYSCKNENDAPAKPANASAAIVETYVVTPTLLNNILSTHGSILPNEEVELKSEVSGQITAINFKEGNRVAAGQLLVQIDDSELLPEAERLKAELKIAENDFERKKQLFEMQGISKEEFEDAELRVNTLQSDVRLVEAKIRKSKVIAPFSGTIGLRNVSSGAYINAGNSIAKLVQTDPVKIEFTVPETYASQITQGTTLDFTLSGSDKKYQATIYAFEPMIDAASRSLKVRAKADNKSGELIPGSFVDLKITLVQIKDAVLVPALAIITDIKGQKIFVIRGGKAVSTFVKTGFQQDDFIQITEGIQAGDSVITTSLLSIKEGAAVQGKVK